VIKNSILIFLGRASNALFVFLLAWVVSRQLGPALFGIFSFLTTVVISANCFSSLGLDVWMIREITKAPEKAKEYFSAILGLKVVTSLVTIALVFFIFQLADLSKGILNLLGIISISIIFNSISQTLWHYGDCFREFIYHSFLWAASNVIKSLTGIVLVSICQELKVLVIGIVFAEALALALSIYVIQKKYGNFKPQFQLLSGWNLLKQSSPIGMGVVFSVLYFRLDTVMLQLMTDERTVGLYNAAYKLFELVLVLPHSLMIVLFPGLVDEFHSQKEKFKVSLKKVLVVYVGVGSIFSLPFFYYSFEVVDLIYGAYFLPSGEILKILATAMVLSFLIFLLSNVLIVSGQEQKNARILVGATLLNLILNLIWIPKYGAIGAAWSTVACEMALIIVLFFQSGKILKTN
tara:strand:+ start:4656 stop:5873 length:1218 start_codon:yes stop_codon:yes gene_type:complete